MKVTIERNVLLKGLQRLQGVVDRRNTMPVLGHILMEAEGQSLTLFGTDLEIGIKTAYPAKVEQGGSATVLGRKVYEIMRELPESEIRLEREENDRVSIEAGQSRFKILGLPVKDYPVKPPVAEEAALAIPRAVLMELIDRTLFAVGENDARYILNGLLLELKIAEHHGRLRLVGTDGHRLAMGEREFNCPGKTASKPQEISAIVPKKAVLEIKKLLEEGEQDPEIAVSKNQILFRQGDCLLLSRLMEGTYPNYEQVIPKGNEKQMIAQRPLLEGALRRVSLLSREKTHAVQLEIQSAKLSLSSQNPDMGEAREDLAVKFNGEPLSTGFNARYLLDILGVMGGEEAQFEFKDPLSPCLVREPQDKDYLCVVMPMRI